MLIHLHIFCSLHFSNSAITSVWHFWRITILQSHCHFVSEIIVYEIPTLIFHHGAQIKPIICAKILSYDLWQFVPTLALSRCVHFNSIILSSRHGGRGILEDEVSKLVGYPHWWNLIYTTFRALYCMEDAVLETQSYSYHPWIHIPKCITQRGIPIVS